MLGFGKVVLKSHVLETCFETTHWGGGGRGGAGLAAVEARCEAQGLGTALRTSTPSGIFQSRTVWWRTRKPQDEEGAPRVC